MHDKILEGCAQGVATEGITSWRAKATTRRRIGTSRSISRQGGGIACEVAGGRRPGASSHLPRFMPHFTDGSGSTTGHWRSISRPLRTAGGSGSRCRSTPAASPVTRHAGMMRMLPCTGRSQDQDLHPTRALHSSHTSLARFACPGIATTGLTVARHPATAPHPVPARGHRQGPRR